MGVLFMGVLWVSICFFVFRDASQLQRSSPASEEISMMRTRHLLYNIDRQQSTKNSQRQHTNHILTHLFSPDSADQQQVPSQSNRTQHPPLQKTQYHP